MVKASILKTSVPIPDFHVIRPNEMLANKRHGTRNEINLALDAVQLHPFQPAMAPYHPDMLKDARIDQLKKDRSRLLMTDREFWMIQLEDARRKGVALRAKGTDQEETERRTQHAEHALEIESRGRAAFFHKVFEIIVAREKGHKKARALEQALWEMIRERLKKAGAHEFFEVRQLIKRGFERHARFLNWRLDNLYAATATHGFVRVKHHGQLMEHVAGQILWDLRRVVTQKAHEWRLDDLYQPGEDGRVVHVHHTAGKPLEHVAAEVHWPKAHRRTEAFKHWHDGVLLVPTPNRGLIHMEHAKQGQTMATAWEMVETPERLEKARVLLEWHLSRLVVNTPNGGTIHAHTHDLGQSPEALHGAHYWRDRREETRKHAEFHKANLMVATGNGGFAKEKAGFARSPEQVTAAVAKPKQEKVHEGHAQFHKNHMFELTATHGVRPLKGHGRSLEGVSAEAADVPRKKRTQGHLEWHRAHQFKQTSNHAFAPIKNSGQSFEKVSFEAWRRVADKMTRHLVESRMHNRYTKTENGGWRHMDTIGKSAAAITALVQKPDEGDGASSPLPTAGGHVLAAEQVPIDQKKRNQKRHAVHEFQRNLAAHADTTSRMRDHVVRLTSNETATNAGTLPIEVARTGGKKVS